ncbi:MAG: DUF6089 family protein [Bacteroidota bacterium]|nr:DUF6089 family protein [Bacteroidota bacterium]
MIFLRHGKPTLGFPFFICIILILIAPIYTFAQFNEIGAGIGGTTYTGDLVRTYNITLNRPALNVFYRQNYSDVVSVKYGLLGGFLHASDKRPIDPMAEMRDYSFNIFLVEASVMGEYHFLDYKNEKSLIKWSPYLFGGVGMMTFFGDGPKNGPYNKIQPVIPFGVGFKYILNPEFNIGVEFGARKTFFDYLDNISEPITPEKNYLYGNQYDKDTYYYLGFSLSYTFYNIPCPYKYK